MWRHPSTIASAAAARLLQYHVVTQTLVRTGAPLTGGTVSLVLPTSARLLPMRSEVPMLWSTSRGSLIHPRTMMTATAFRNAFPPHTHKLTEKSNPLPSPLVWRGSCVIIVFVFSLFFSASNTRAKEEDKTSSCSFFFYIFEFYNRDYVVCLFISRFPHCSSWQRLSNLNKKNERYFVELCSLFVYILIPTSFAWLLCSRIFFNYYYYCRLNSSHF